MPMKGRFPIRRTLQYLNQGDIVFKESVKVMTINYNTRSTASEGARKFIYFTIPQIQYKNIWVQIAMFKNMTPSPFIKFYLDTGEQVLVDAEDKTYTEIAQHIKKILGKSDPLSSFPDMEEGAHSATNTNEDYDSGLLKKVANMRQSSHFQSLIRDTPARETLAREAAAKKALQHPATFGPRKYHLRECMCEIEGQIPCPGKVPLPKEMTGKYQAALKKIAAESESM